MALLGAPNSETEMKKKSKTVTEAERQRRREAAKRQHLADQLLYSRSDVMRMLGVSMSTVIRLEMEGRLGKALKLFGAEGGKTFYGAEAVKSLISTEEGAR